MYWRLKSASLTARIIKDSKCVCLDFKRQSLLRRINQRLKVRNHKINDWLTRYRRARIWKFLRGSTAISKNTINYLRASNATSNRLISTQISFHLRTIEFCSANPKSLWCSVSTRTRRSKVMSVSRHSQLTMTDSLTSSKSLKTNLSTQTNAK